MGTSNLKVYLAKKDISLKELSYASGVTVQTLSNLANNNRKPNISTAMAIAEALGVHVTKLWDIYDYAKVKRRRTS